MVDLVGAVQEDNSKDLAPVIPEAGVQECCYIGAGAYRCFLQRCRGLPSAPEFQGGGNGDGFSLSDPLYPHQFLYGKLSQFIQVIFSLPQNLPGEVDSCFIPRAIMNQNGQQFGNSEIFCTMRK